MEQWGRLGRFQRYPRHCDGSQCFRTIGIARWSQEFGADQSWAWVFGWVAYSCTCNERLIAPIHSTGPLAKCPRQVNQKWEVTKVEWSPIKKPDSFAAVAAHDRVELLQTSPDHIHHSRAYTWHTRHVTDIDWNHQGAPVLASASIDSFVHLWDVRSASSKPCGSLNTLLPASHVRLIQTSLTKERNLQ